MGILVQQPVCRLSEKAFHKLDYQVMSLAFDLYNSVGNLWDEDDYKSKLLERSAATGLNAHSEVMISVTHKDFSKQYFIDLLVEGVVYELKTAVNIALPHESQTLNYLFLTDTQHGKIINFRPDSLEWRFVSTGLTTTQRKFYTLDTSKLDRHSQETIHLPDLLSELLDEWGAYLDIQLYKEAALFFMKHPISDAHSRFCPLTPEVIMHFSGLTRKKAAYQKNLQKYLNASPYHQLDWINFDKSQIELCSLR